MKKEEDEISSSFIVNKMTEKLKLPEDVKNTLAEYKIVMNTCERLDIPYQFVFLPLILF